MNICSQGVGHDHFLAHPATISKLANALVTSGLVAAALVDSGKVVAATPALYELLGVAAPDATDVAFSLQSITAENDRPAVDNFCELFLREGSSAALRCTLVHASGAIVPVLLSGSAVLMDDTWQILLQARDLTCRPVAMAEAAATAEHALPGLVGAVDPVTGFPTRALLLDRMKIALAAARRHRRLAAVLRVNLKRFDSLLQSLAPEAAEEVEAIVAETLRNCVRDCDTVARLGRHAFVLLLSEIRERNDAGVSAARVVAAITALFQRNDPVRPVLPHVGVAVYPTDGVNAEQLLCGAAAAARLAGELPNGGFVLADATQAGFSLLETLEFRDEFLVGVEPIDTAHRAIMARVNALIDGARAGREVYALEAEIRAIAALLREHFLAEAQHVAGTQHPGAIDLKTRNLRFLDEIDCILLNVQPQTVLLAIRHLHDWLLPHLLDVQQQPSQ